MDVTAIDPARVEHARALWSGNAWVVRVDLIGGVLLDLDGFADQAEAQRCAEGLHPSVALTNMAQQSQDHRPDNTTRHPSTAPAVDQGGSTWAR